MIESETERLLRESLRRRAERAPDGTLLADRIVAAARGSDDRVVRRSFRWQTWVTPLVSAAAVAAVALVLVQGSDTPTGGGSAASANSAAMKAPVPYDAGGEAAGSSSAAAGAVRAPQATRSAPGTTSPALSGVRVTDLTFVSDTEGWAFGSARCLSGSGARCPALLHTTDGRTWSSMSTPPIEPGHAKLGIRFANDQVGYAYDPSVLFMTTDGGRNWHRQSGGAVALETLDQNVIRLVSDKTGCPGPCDLRIERSNIGSSTWKTIGGTQPLSGVSSLQLTRAGQEVYVLTRRNPAGGAPAQTSTLLALNDSGTAEVNAGEPCPQPSTSAGEVDSVAVAAAPNRRVAALCQPRGNRTPAFVATSTDAGRSFTPAAGTLPTGTLDLLAGDPRTVLLSGDSGGIYRSTDSGVNWHRVPGIGSVRFLGFESTKVGRALTSDGTTVWTTTDGGLHWRATGFG